MRIEIDLEGNITEHEDAPIVLPTEQEILAEKVAEAKAYLASTDYKVLPDYEPKSDEIIALRAEAREFIRTNDVPNP